MKRCFLLFLTLFVLISCTGNDIPAAPVTTSNITENNTDFITMSTEDTAAEDTTPVSSAASPEPTIRYEKQYNVTKITTTSYDTFQYQYKDKFYQSTYRRIDGERRVCLTSWNGDGSIADVVYYPDPDPDAWNPPFYIFPLSDGRTVMVHEARIWDQNKEHSHFDLQITLLSADHTVEKQTTVPDDMHVIASVMRYAPCVLYEKTDGTFSLIFTLHRYIPGALGTILDNTIYVYDETLSEVQKVQIPDDVTSDTIHRIDDKTYRVGKFINELLKIDTTLGTSRPHGGFRLPASMLDAVVCGAYTDQIYFRADDGLYLYRNDAQPKMLIEWSSSPFSIAYMREHGSTIHIIDDTHFFIESQAKLSEGTSIGVFHVEVTEVPVVEKPTLRLAYIGLIPSGWLNDMVYYFNQQSTEYHIELQQYLCQSSDEEQAVLNELLLTEPRPDIFFSESTDLFSVHNGKNIYLDLSPVTCGKVFGCIYDIHGENGALYQLPLAMTAALLVSPSEIEDGALTWEELDKLVDTSDDRNILTSDPNLDTIIYQNTLMQFVDRDNQTASFDSEAFSTAITVLQKLDGVTDPTAGQLAHQSGHYCITNGMLPRRLADGGIKLFSFHFNNIRAYGAMRLIFGDTPYTLCGYPTVDGSLSARIHGKSYLSVSAECAYPDAALSFVSFLLSDDAQTNTTLTDNALPVTPSAMQAMLDLHRWQYYDKQLGRDLTESPDTQTLFLSWHGTTPEFDPGYGNTNADGTPGDKAAEIFHIMNFTEEDDRRIMDFFNNVTTYVSADDQVETIVNEELSFWYGNARSLEDTGDIINSRVWIYLNE